MFGTYTAELPDVKPVYGTVSALKSWNPIWANFQVFSTMLNDSIKTKKWSDKVKVWFSKTYWRPEDCIEEKGAKDFHVKFNPVVTTDVQVFSFFQLIFTIAVSGSVLFFISEYTKTEIAIIGVFIISLTTLTSMLLQSHNAYIALFILSCLGAVGITSFEIIDYEVLSSKLLVAQFGISAFGIAVIALYKRLFGVELANA
jgi:hypothetical protein